MNKKAMKLEATEMVRQAIREQGVTENDGIVEAVSDLLEAIDVDKAYLIQCVKQVLDTNRSNPFNAILDMIGLRIVRPETAMRELDEMLEAPEDIEFSVASADEACLTSFLCLNPTTARAAAGSMVQVIKKHEDEHRRQMKDQQRSVHDLQDRVEILQDALHKAQAENESLRSAVAEQVQYLLSQLGPQADPVTERLTELLDDLDMQVVWDPKGMTLPESGMFATLKCQDPASRKAKPCILSGNRVVAKGLMFISA